MLIDLPEIQEKNYIKLISNINKDYENKNYKKFPKYIDTLLNLMNKNPENSNLSLFILSIIVEEKPEDFSKSDIKIIKKYLDSTSLKERINAVIIIGFYLLDILKSDEERDVSDIQKFIQLIKDEELEIRQNLCNFLIDFPSSIDIQFLLELDLLVEALKIECDPEIIKTLETILLRLQPKMSLKILSDYVQKLSSFYHESKSPERSDALLKLLEAEIPTLKKKRLEKNISKKELETLIHNRLPLVRLTDLNKLADEEDLSMEEVINYVESSQNDDDFYYFIYNEKNHKKLLEFEKKELLSYLSMEKIKIDDIIKEFSHIGISHPSIVAVFIQDLMKQKILKGYLNKNYFYSWKYLIKDFSQILRNQGKITIDSHSKNIDRDIIFKIVQEISQQPAFNGVFTADNSKYYTYSSITKEIEKSSSKANAVDLSIYRKKYGQESFLQLEEYCKKNFLTPFNSNHLWLTNLGKTRIQQILHVCEQIGEFNIEERAEELEIPDILIYRFTKEIFEKKNGFWNENQTIFYYSKTIKRKIAEIQKIMDKIERDKAIEELAQELQIDKNEISNKVDEKLNRLAEELSNKEEFDINLVIRDLQMEYKEFINFVNTFEKDYLIINNKIIFSEKRIKEEEAHIISLIQKESIEKPIINIDSIAARLKCANTIILTLTKQLFDEEKIKGIWIVDDKKFLTPLGIQEKMLDSQIYIELNTIIEEITPTEENLQLFEECIQQLISKGQLKGIYNPETKIFQSNEIAGEASLILERSRFEKELNPHINDLDLAYNMLRDIFLSDDLKPAAIDEYERILQETIKKILDSRSFIQRLINNANSRLHLHRTQGKKTRDRNKSKKSDKQEEVKQSFEDDEYIANLLNDFNNWKTLILTIEQKAGQIVFLKKKLKSRPEDEENRKKLDDLIEYLGFSN